MDLKKGAAETPAKSSGQSDSQQDVRKDDPELDAHFRSLPASYRIYIELGKPEEALLHKKLLAGARIPENCPVFHVRFMENLGIKREVTEGREVSGHKESDYVHEVIFATTDKPKTLTQLSGLLSDFGLHIRVAHIFSTNDGYSLMVFVVDGWPTEDSEDLSEELRKAIARQEGNWAVTPHSKAVLEKGSSKEWEIDTRLVILRDRIGSGSNSYIHLGRYFGQTVAVKIIRPEALDDPTSQKVAQFAQEVSILRKYQHQNLVHFIGACTKSPKFWLVTEYMSGGNVHEYLKNHDVKLSQLLKFAIDACKAMEYLHQNNIIHRDLKAANLLIGTDKVVKVADFGVSRSLPEEGIMTAETGTYKWMAPEVLSHEPYGLKADVYSFGIVLWELVAAKVPYEGMPGLGAALGVVTKGQRPEIPTTVHPKYSELMQRCWATNPDDRPSFSETRAELEQLLQEIEEIPNAESRS